MEDCFGSGGRRAHERKLTFASADFHNKRIGDGLFKSDPGNLTVDSCCQSPSLPMRAHSKEEGVKITLTIVKV
uniref:Uncharacterized protein n=1 Tax=Leersia perrieri TaxID=77586 RepID=A0A0D9VZQ2_9ORYZ